MRKVKGPAEGTKTQISVSRVERALAGVVDGRLTHSALQVNSGVSGWYLSHALVQLIRLGKVEYVAEGYWQAR